MRQAPGLPRTATSEQRLERARLVAENALARYGRNVVAIGVYGSTARGADGPYSDLELAIVLREPVGVERHEYYFEGWKTEVEFWQAAALLQYVREIDISWPLRGGQFLHVLALYDPEDFWAGLRRHVEEMPDDVFREALREASVGEFLEHVAKYRNARLRRDDPAIRWAAWQLARDALCLVGLANRTYYTSQSDALRRSPTLPLVPPGYAELMELFNSGDLTDLERLDHRCEGLVTGLLVLLRSLAIELEVRERPI